MSAPIEVRPYGAIKAALKDFFLGCRDWRLAFVFSIEDLKDRYHRTIIGPLWIAASFAAFIGVKFYIFSALNDSEWTYFASYLTIGYMVWVLLQTAFVDGAMSLIQARGWILGLRCNYSTFILQALFRSVLTMLITAVVAYSVSFLLYPYSLQALLWSLTGVMAIIPLVLCVQIILALSCVFARDILQLVQATMRIMFFVTPIIWMPSMLGDKADVIQFNPFTHLIAVVREPLLGEPFPELSWLVLLGLTITALVLVMILYPLCYHRISKHI